MFGKFNKIIKNPLKKEESGQIIYRNTKKLRVSFSHYFKMFLRWLNLKDEVGEELIKEEDPISEIFTYWSKSMLMWLFNVIYTGSLILIAVIPIYRIPLELIPFTIFSFGVAYFVLTEATKEFRNIIKKGANA